MGIVQRVNLCKRGEPHASSNLCRSKSALRPIGYFGACLYLWAIASNVSTDRIDAALFVLASLVLVTTALNQTATGPYAYDRIVCSTALFIGTTAASILTSHSVQTSAVMSMALLPATLMFFLVTRVLDRHDYVRLLCVALAAWSAYISAQVLIVWLSGGVTDPTQAIKNARTAILVVPNDIMLTGVLMPIAMALFIDTKNNRLVRTIAIVSITLGIVATTLVQSRVGTVTLLIASIVWALFAASRRTLLSLVLVAATVASVDCVSGFALLSKFVDRTIEPRLVLWWAGSKMFLDAPVFGYGPGTFDLYYQQFLARTDIPPWLFADTRGMPWMHNLYLETAAERGVLGLVALISLLAGGAAAAWKILRNRGNKNEMSMCLVSAGVGASFTTFCLVAGFELSFARLWVAVTFFVILALLNVLVRLEGREQPCADQS